MDSGGIFLRLETDVVGFARFVVDPSTKNPRETIHGHSLTGFAKAGEHLVAVYDVRIFSEFMHLPYPYHFRSIENIPKLLGDLNDGGNMFKTVVAWDMHRTVKTSHSFFSLSDDPKIYSVKTVQSVLENRPRRPSKVRFQDDLRNPETKGDIGAAFNSSTDFIDLTGASDEDENEDLVDDSQLSSYNVVDSDSDDSLEQGMHDIFEESVDQFEIERMQEEAEEKRKRKIQERQNAALSSGTSALSDSSSMLFRSQSSKITKRTLKGLSPAERIMMRLNKKESLASTARQTSNSSNGNIDRGSASSSSRTGNKNSPTNQVHSLATESHSQDSGARSSHELLVSPQHEIVGNDDDLSALGRRVANAHSDSGNRSRESTFSDGLIEVSAPKMSRNILPEIRKRTYRFKNRRPASEPLVGIRKQTALDMASRSIQINPFNESRFCCNSACHSSVNPDHAAAQYRRFLAMDRADRKNALTLMFNKEMNQFWFDGQPVCSRFMVSLSFSNQLQSAVKNTAKARASASILACPREVKSITKKDQIIIYLTDVAGTLGDALPTKNQFNLPLLTKKQVYERFLNSVVFEPGVEPISFSYFCDIWKKHCSQFKVHRHHGFAVCSVCEKLRSNLANCESIAIQEEIRAQMDVHYKLMAAERRGYAERIDLSKKFPGKYMSIVVDGADQKGYGLPHFVFKTKDEKGHKMKVKCVGVLEHGSQKSLSLFAMTEEFESGANHVLEAVHRVVQKKKDESGRLPEVFFIQADNCTRENKNKYFMGYCEMLVAKGVFLQVQVSFLPVGHTHTDIDQSFSAVANRLKFFDAFTMEDLLLQLKNCYNHRTRAEMMEKVANFSGLCDDDGCLRKIHGISQYRYFRFSRGEVSQIGEENLGIHDMNYSTTCDVKVQLSDDWSPLDNSSRKMGFLRKVPNIRYTPQTDTTPPDNVLEVNKHLESVEDRIASEEKMQSLLRLKERIYKRRIEVFHWDINTAFELHGDYVGITGAELNDERRQITSDDCTIIERLSYPPNSFLAIRTEEGSDDPFWIARTIQVAKEDQQGNALKLKVRWYEAKRGSKDAFSAKYKMATFLKGSRHQFFDDQIDVRSIVCQFDGLTQSGGLHIRTQKAIRQCLNLN